MISAQEWMAIPPAWRALVSEINGGRIPDGEPGIRDVDNPCDVFEPFGEPFETTRRHGDCESDGHYICIECVHISQSRFREKRDLCRDCGAPLFKSRALGDTCSVQCTPLLPDVFG